MTMRAAAGMVMVVKLITLMVLVLVIGEYSTSKYYGGEASLIRMPWEKESAAAGTTTRWAVLVAGSSGYWNYRHQADVCHAYQLLKRGGLKDENIVVFMYDDIAHNPENPKKGVIINNPKGQDVYAGVPKDYTGEDVNTHNLYAVLLGNKTAIRGGSGKVINSTSNDHVFIFYSDHGGPGVLGMPNMPFLYANDFVNVLKQMHKLRRYREMVIYLEACESGSIFQGLLPNNINIYATTASNGEESSYGTYCPGLNPPPPEEFLTCLGDLYSVSWMEDSDCHNLKKESVKEQYLKVKRRASNNFTYTLGSHVMQYGNKSLRKEKLYLYQGYDPSNANATENRIPWDGPMEVINQRDADLLFFWQKLRRAKEGSKEKARIQKEMVEMMTRRSLVDNSVEVITHLLFGKDVAPKLVNVIRPKDQALVDDWECLKSTVEVYERICGPLGQYGMKHMRVFANVCNQGVPVDVIREACLEACTSLKSP